MRALVYIRQRLGCTGLVLHMEVCVHLEKACSEWFGVFPASNSSEHMIPYQNHWPDVIGAVGFVATPHTGLQLPWAFRHLPGQHKCTLRHNLHMRTAR